MTEEPPAAPLVICVDVGSTYTKAALVDVADGVLVATTQHPTTLGSDVLEGMDACCEQLAEREPRAAGAPVVACSSAGGGLRVAVVGNEELITAEAGRRVALSSGGRVVRVVAGPEVRSAGTGGGLPAALEADRPDVVLLVGGTDGGNSEVLLRCARALAGWSGPVVVAGNVEAQQEVAAALSGGGTPHVLADNVVPRIGTLAPEPARRAIRAMFLEHVIGGKGLSRSPRFAETVRAATPDAVLSAVEVLAEEVGDLAVVDVGGATTDVYSVVSPPGDGGAAEEDAEETVRDVIGRPPVGRTVEGDLGVRWSAVTTVEEAAAAGFVTGPALDAARERARRRQAGEPVTPTTAPEDQGEHDLDADLAGWAIGVALRRHAGRAVVRPGDDVATRVVDRDGTDLRQVRLLLGSGGVLRHRPDGADLLRRHLPAVGGWQLPDEAVCAVDTDYVLAAAGLLASSHPAAARALLRPLAALAGEDSTRTHS